MAESLTSRDRILALLSQEPGLHLRELPRRLELSLRAIRYHLETLQEDGLVVAYPAGRFLRWFPRNAISQEDRVLISALQVRGQRDILESLLLRGPLRFVDLSRTGLSPGSLANCLTQLERSGLLVVDATRQYRLKDPEAVRMRLSLYRTRFPHLLADAARELFEETR